MDSYEQSIVALKKRLDLKVGDIYEDCSYHPVICTFIDYDDDEIRGISLIDGSSPRSCSLIHCAVRELTLQEAVSIKVNGPQDYEAAQSIPKNKQWWQINGM